MAQSGLGYLIGFLGANGSYDAMYAVVLTVAFLGFAADRGYRPRSFVRRPRRPLKARPL